MQQKRIIGYTVNRGNLHDSRTFKRLYDKLKPYGIKKLIADFPYKTPAIAKLLIDDNIDPISPCRRPQTKDMFFKKYEHIYDEYCNCCICSNNKVLKYSTTNREGVSRIQKLCLRLCELFVFASVYRECKPCKGLYPSYMGKPHRNLRRLASHKK